jgi:hypothetical protein
LRLHRIVGSLLVILLVSVALGATTIDVSSTGNISSLPGRWFDYVVIIMLENHDINYTYGVSVAPNSWNNISHTCLGNCTYFDTLANANGLAEGFTNTGVSDGSASDYVAITSGNGTAPASCNNGVFPYEPTGCSPMAMHNIVDSLESGHLTWKAYMEGCPSQCGGGPTGCANIDVFGTGANYGPNHNPFVYYSDIQNNATRCANIVSANSSSSSQNVCWPTPVINDDVLINDLNSVFGASNYMFLSPNTVDDIHDCNDVSVGNGWLSQLVPQILNSNLFKTRRAALFVTFDEAGCTASNPSPCPSSIPQFYALWASNSTNPLSKTRIGFKSSVSYSHFSALKTIEDNWALPPLIASTDGSSNDMQEFFTG